MFQDARELGVIRAMQDLELLVEPSGVRAVLLKELTV